MKIKFFSYIVSIITCTFCTFPLHSREYTISSIDAESFVDDKYDIFWEAAGITEQGCVYGRQWKDTHGGSSQDKLFFYTPKNGYTFIDFKSGLHSIIANSIGQFAGYDGNIPFIWSKALGIYHLSTIKNTNVNNNLSINDLSQVLVNTNQHNMFLYKPFMWNRGTITEMGPETTFARQFEDLGYHVMSVKLMAINNNGELAGYISYGKYNEKQKKYIVTGDLAFFWNGDVHLIPLDLFNGYVHKIKLTNMGVVLLNTYKATYLWDIQNGLQSIPDFFGESINDDSIIAGYRVERGYKGEEITRIPCIWKAGKVIELAALLGVPNITQIAPRFSDNYSIEAIDEIISINNKGQMVCRGLIWGNWYPCILNPKEKP